MYIVKQYLANLGRSTRDPLYRNSFLLILGRILNVGCGFLFWVIAARLYSIMDIGLATVLVSSLSLVMLFSTLGFDQSIIRFLPIKDKSNVFNTCLVLIVISSFLFSSLYILSIKQFSPSLYFLQEPKYFLLFIIFALLNSITTSTANAFVAMRITECYVFQSIFLAVRIPLLVPFVFLGSIGIFGALGFASLLASLYALLLSTKYINLKPKIDKLFLLESLKFSAGNYISNALSVAPNFILPIVILNLLGSTEAAKYYISFAIANLVLIIPNALSTTLFVEGSYGENLRSNTIKTCLAIYSLLIPTVIIIYFFGEFLLGLFGKDYVSSFQLLRLIVLSSLFSSIYILFISIQNVRMNMKNIIEINICMFAILMTLCYIFIIKLGTVGIGYAWIITYIILDLGILGLTRRNKWINGGLTEIRR